MEINIKKQVLYVLIFLFNAGCTPQDTKTLPGYIEGKYVYVTSNYPGTLEKLSVKLGETVKANQILFSLDPNPQEDELSSIKAQVEQAKFDKIKLEAELELQKSLYARKKELFQKKVIAKEELDITNNLYLQAQSGVSASAANLLRIEADEKKMQWILKQKSMTIPIGGVVNDIYYLPGENIAANSPVMAILVPNEIKIIFYAQVNVLGTLKLNQIVNVGCDNCTTFKAQITYISQQAEFTPPVIYSKEVQSKLTFRIEAKPVARTTLSAIHPGQPVNIRL